MQAIVTAFDEPWRERVEEIWAELQAVLGLRAVAGTLEPHLTYHVADSYERQTVEAAIERLSGSIKSFEVETHGVGVFHGRNAGIFLHVTRTDALQALHGAVWAAVNAPAAGTHDVYAPSTWIPHITLAGASLTAEQISDAHRLLERRDYNWRLPVTNVCFVPDAESKTAAWTRWELARPQK